MSRDSKNAPGRVRDAIVDVLSASPTPLKVATIVARVGQRIGETPPSSIRSYLRLNTPDLFVREVRGTYRARRNPSRQRQLPIPETDKGREKRATPFLFRQSELHHDDCFAWLAGQPPHSMHAVVTDPPYGLHEYTREQQRKLRAGKGGVWRIPPSFDGHRRSPLPRFTTLDTDQLADIREFFVRWTRVLLPVLVPGANVVASNPLVSPLVATALSEAGLERRGEIIRLTMTMRGGDRPKGAHDEFRDVSVMPRSMWEPWLVYRKPLDGRVRDNLRKWKTGGLPPPGPRQTLRRRHSIGAEPQHGTPARPASQPEVAGVSPPRGARRAATRRRARPGPVCRCRLHARGMQRRRLRQRRRRARPSVFFPCRESYSETDDVSGIGR